jgi:hypothetical protein
MPGRRGRCSGISWSTLSEVLPVPLGAPGRRVPRCSAPLQERSRLPESLHINGRNRAAGVAASSEGSSSCSRPPCPTADWCRARGPGRVPTAPRAGVRTASRPARARLIAAHREPPIRVAGGLQATATPAAATPQNDTPQARAPEPSVARGVRCAGGPIALEIVSDCGQPVSSEPWLASRCGSNARPTA